MGTPRTPLRLSACWGALGLLLSAGASSCSFVFDDSVRQCDVDADCETRGFRDSVCNLVTNTCEAKPIDPKWGCLDGRDPPATTGQLINLTLEVVDAVKRQPVVGARVRACGRLDAQCDAPLVNDVLVNAAGTVELGVPDDFPGYFEMRGPATDDPDNPYIQQLFYLPIREIARGKGRRAILFKLEDAQNLLGLVQGTFVVGDPPNAALIATSLDCQGETTAGITMNLASVTAQSSRTKSMYTDKSNLPNPTATQTTESGTFALTNLNAGSVAVSANINELQRTMGDDSVGVLRNDWLTVIYVAP